MKPLKALTGTIKGLSGLYLHTLLTDEDHVIVARCLDFSVSSHGDDEQDTLASLSDSVTDYLDYAIRRGAFDEIIDPAEEIFWNIFREQDKSYSGTGGNYDLERYTKSLPRSMAYH